MQTRYKISEIKNYNEKIEQSFNILNEHIKQKVKNLEEELYIFELGTKLNDYSVYCDKDGLLFRNDLDYDEVRNINLILDNNKKVFCKKIKKIVKIIDKKIDKKLKETFDNYYNITEVVK